MSKPYDKEMRYRCEYTPLVRVVNDGDGKRLEWQEQDETGFPHRLCLSDADIKVLIQMLEEVLK